MQFVRPAIARHPASFGRSYDRPASQDAPQLVNDLKLFAMTFLAGFLFVSILIG